MSEYNIEYGDTGQPHPFHILQPSIWPMLASLAGGLFSIAMVLFMHEVEFAGFEFGLETVAIGTLSVLAVAFFWWRDVLVESLQKGTHSPIAQIGFRYGMALFILSELMLFVAFFWAFFDASLFIDDPVQFNRMEYAQAVWPPLGLETTPPLELPLFMTMILLLSGRAVTWAQHAIKRNRQAEVTKALGLSVLCATFFLCLQGYEYTQVRFGFTEGAYSSIFFMATGFHGFHVLVGIILLFVCWVRSAKGHFTAERHFGFEAAAWYWHFVNIVWCFLFLSIYVWGNGIGVHPTL